MGKVIVIWFLTFFSPKCLVHLPDFEQSDLSLDRYFYFILFHFIFMDGIVYTST
jgi:hypothetical protein